MVTNILKINCSLQSERRHRAADLHLDLSGKGRPALEFEKKLHYRRHHQGQELHSHCRHAAIRPAWYNYHFNPDNIRSVSSVVWIRKKPGIRGGARVRVPLSLVRLNFVQQLPKFDEIAAQAALNSIAPGDRWDLWVRKEEIPLVQRIPLLAETKAEPTPCAGISVHADEPLQCGLPHHSWVGDAREQPAHPLEVLPNERRVQEVTPRRAEKNWFRHSFKCIAECSQI